MNRKNFKSWSRLTMNVSLQAAFVAALWYSDTEPGVYRLYLAGQWFSLLVAVMAWVGIALAPESTKTPAFKSGMDGYRNGHHPPKWVVGYLNLAQVGLCVFRGWWWLALLCAMVAIAESLIRDMIAVEIQKADAPTPPPGPLDALFTKATPPRAPKPSKSNTNKNAN